VLLGRLPVNTAAEAATVVNKILAYERAPRPGEWNARHVFVADNGDDGGDFAAASDQVLSRLVDPWVGQSIYLDDLSVEVAHEQVVTAWQRGALLISFTGHSSWHQWSEESLLDIWDVPALSNDQRWPVMLSMTCFTGFFHHPEYGTLDEMLLRQEGGGAVATWSPSGLGVNTAHQRLHAGFYQAVLEAGEPLLGPATLSGKLNVYGYSDDLLDTYHLFGDPAMALNLTIRPLPFSTYLPIVSSEP
jgi:hypothetical protein